MVIRYHCVPIIRLCFFSSPILKFSKNLYNENDILPNFCSRDYFHFCFTEQFLIYPTEKDLFYAKPVMSITGKGNSAFVLFRSKNITLCQCGV